jgi:hypothetical protein
MQLTDDLPCGNVDGVAHVVVGAPLGDTRRQRQYRLRPVERWI